MPKVLDAYQTVVTAITPVLAGLHRKVVAIDGRDGSGKTTMGRFLAWHFNCTLLETDNFLVRRQGTLQYREDEIRRIIAGRLDSDLPIIVEGVAILDLLDKLTIAPDMHIHITNPNQSSGRDLEPLLNEYESRRNPVTAAHVAVTVYEQ